MTVENKTFVFMISWIFWLVGLSFLNSTRIGHVILYYSLLLMILFVVLSEYAQITPFITGITNLGSLNSSIKNLSSAVTSATSNITPLSSTGSIIANPSGTTLTPGGVAPIRGTTLPALQ